MLGFQLKKQTLISSFPTIAPILSVHFSAKLLKKLSIFTVSIPPIWLSSPSQAWHRPRPAPHLQHWYWAFPLSSFLGLWTSVTAERGSQCVTWPSRNSNSGTQLDSLSFFPIAFKVLILPFLALYLNICHHQSFLVLNTFQQLWVWGIETPEVTASIYFQCPGSWCEWTRLLEEASHR